MPRGAKKKYDEESEKISVRAPKSKKKEVLSRIENEILIDYTSDYYKKKQKLKLKVK